MDHLKNWKSRLEFMEGKKEFNSNARNKIIWLGIAIAVFLWLVESFVYLYFHQGKLFNAFIFPDLHDFLVRSLVVFLIIVFSVYSRNAAVKFRKEREKKLKIEEDYKELVEKANSIILRMDIQGNITFLNEYAQRFFGYKEKDILGKNVIGTIVSKTDKAGQNLSEMLNNIVADPVKYVSNENENMLNTGERVWISWTNKLIYDEKGRVEGVLSVGNDITEIKKIQTDLQRSCQTIRDIISKAPFGIYLVNSSGRVDYVNPAMLQISGTTYEQFINLNVLELPTYKKIGFDEKIRSALEGQPFSLKDVVYTSYFSKKTTIRDISGLPFEEAGEKKVLVFVEDITERKRLEYLKDEFVSSVSHELRTPLSIVKEGVSLVLDKVVGSINEKQQSVLTTAKDNIDRLARVINELLDISRIEAGKVQLERKQIDIVELIKKVDLSFEQLLKEKGIELKLDFSKDKIIVYIDADLISQVFMNLVGNSLKFTSKGFIKISVVEKNDMVECVVEDTGIGIAQENIPKLFEKFWQFRRLPGAGEKGTGLGLPIVKGIIELHNGKIWVESQLDKGSKFIFVLPKTDEGAF
ncbi:MAG: PAS domain-containing sensor histidine kinase [Candidatus Omnitrophota bacterium]